MKVVGVDWKGVRVVIEFNRHKPIFLGTLKAIQCKANKPIYAFIEIGVKNLNSENYKFWITALLHELGHLDHFKELIERYGELVISEIKSRIVFGDRELLKRIEVEANKRALKYLQDIGLLDSETYLFICLALGSYYTENLKLKERLWNLLNYLSSRSPNNKGDRNE